MTDKEKIIQIIPLSGGMGMFVNLYRCKFDDYGNEIRDELLDLPIPETDDWGVPICDIYDVACLALIENEHGERRVIPLICNENDRKSILPADDYETYYSCELYNNLDNNEKQICVKTQNGLGEFFFTKKTSRFIQYRKRKEEDIYTFCFEVNGTLVDVGEYYSKESALFVFNDFKSSDSDYYVMPSAQEAEELYERKKEIDDIESAKLTFEKYFADECVKWLISKGYRTIDEIEKLTDDDLHANEISKKNFQYFHAGINRLKNKTALKNKTVLQKRRGMSR